ncbi:hypothetical protein [Lake Baikal phage Baikal-20-5m-C28]|nr:hypothetical protein [Lake Baikal phage Baikal-20-5m-C28]
MSLLTTSLTNPSDRKAVYDAIVEISNSMTRMASERDLIKETLAAVKDKYDLHPRYTRQLAKIYHKQNFLEVKAEQDEVEELYESITS